jgi:hemerythrin-like domain-containing protein
MDYMINFPDMWHHPREDVIFKRLTLRCPDSSVLVRGLTQEHRDLATQNRRLAAALRNLSMDIEMPREWLERQISLCVSRTFEHMRKEDEFYFPLAMHVLTDEDWHAIESEIQKVSEDPLFGDKVRGDYLKLQERVTATQVGPR